MSRNRKLPPDDVLLDLFRQGVAHGTIAERYNASRAAVTAAKKRLMGATGSQSPAAAERQYPAPDERRTVRPTEIQFRFHIHHTVMSLPRIPTIDGPFQGNQQ